MKKSKRKLEIKEDKIQVEPIQKPNKIRATALPIILQLGNHKNWGTPFSVWCEIMKIYTYRTELNPKMNAGKILETPIINYYRSLEKDYIMTPAERYGFYGMKKADYFDNDLFKGKWDSLIVDRNDNTIIKKVLEVKTTGEEHRSEWQTCIPLDYQVQAGLYAYLLNVDEIVFITTFLKAKNYENPGRVKLSSKNTTIYSLRLSVDFPNFEESIIQPAKEWWNEYVMSGCSPAFNLDNEVDAKIIEQIKLQYEIK